MIIKGTVREGRKLGRELGFPTANVDISPRCEIESGVYRSSVEVDGESFRAVTNIGTNPTVGATVRRAESHLLNFQGDLYNKEITITLGDRLRAERRFDSLEELRLQIARDVALASQQ